MPEVGTYEIWASVKDSHNAWSNWAIFTVQVQRAVHKDSCFVYVSSEYSANGLFQPSVGYLGKTTYNGEDAFYISSNATIYGSIARPFDGGRVDYTVANFGSDRCKISSVFGSGTARPVAFTYNNTSMYPGKSYYLKFNGQSGDIFYLDYSFSSINASAHCYFIVK